MLQLNHWGLGGSGGTPDNWYVDVGPNIWRYRNVQTAEDCATARENWINEDRPVSFDEIVSFDEGLSLPEQEALPGDADDSGYYHVRVSTKSKPTSDEVRLDLSRDEIESRFVAPYRDGRPIVINGAAIPVNDLARLCVTWTEQSSDALRPMVEGETIGRTYATPVAWLIADRGKDVTDEFITGPPGSAAPTPAPQAITHLPLYIDVQVIHEIRMQASSCRFDCTKLLGLIDELNENYRDGNVYAAHALLRAILDHVPPILGCPDFNTVVSNYSWTRTDRKYMQRLLDFRNQADDALHRQISPKPDLLSLDDMPSRAGVRRMLQECAAKL